MNPKLFLALILFFADMKRSRWWLWRGGKYPPTRIEVEPVTKFMKRELEMSDLIQSSNGNGGITKEELHG